MVMHMFHSWKKLGTPLGFSILRSSRDGLDSTRAVGTFYCSLNWEYFYIEEEKQKKVHIQQIA